MEVHFTPEQETQLSQAAAHAGIDPERLVMDAALCLLEDEAQGRREDMVKSHEELLSLQRSYNFVSDGVLIADVLARVPVLYTLLREAVEQLHRVFGKGCLLQLEALTSDDDTVLRVMVKLSKDTKTPAALMRGFKLDWWLRNCSQSEASLVFDYEIANGF